jgi:hypothetical protein
VDAGGASVWTCIRVRKRRDSQPLLELPGYDVTTLAEKSGRSESLIYSCFALLHLIPDVAEAFKAERITASHATSSRVSRRISSSKRSGHAGARIIGTRKPTSSLPSTSQPDREQRLSPA